MIRNIHRRYFEIWASEQAQNVFLKALLVLISVLFVIQSVAFIVVAMRKPVLFGVGAEETKLLAWQPPSEALLAEELKRVVRRYVETHYTWEYMNVEQAHQAAARFVSEKFLRTYAAANAEQVRIAKEKKISQKVYLYDIQVDAKNLLARVSMDRILIVETLRATNPLILEVSFEAGSRTASNPEGIYITGEKVLDSRNGG